MKTNPDEPGFLGRLQHIQDPVPPGLFEAVQQRRKRRPALFVWLVSLALVGALGYVMWPVSTAIEADLASV